MAHICYQVSASTATGDTVKTSIGNLQLSSRARKILGVFVTWGGAGMTTLEGVSGILEVESSNLPNIQPLQIPLNASVPVTSGVANHEPKIWPVNLACKGQEILTGYVTMDMTQTINPSARWGVAIEVDD